MPLQELLLDTLTNSTRAVTDIETKQFIFKKQINRSNLLTLRSDPVHNSQGAKSYRVNPVQIEEFKAFRYLNIHEVDF